MGADGKVWLIKSGGRIIGPNELATVKSLLMAKEVSLLDEVCEPQSRWQPIRDHQSFVHILDEWNAMQNNSGDITTNLSTVTGSVTEDINAVADEITAEVGEFQSQLKEIVYEDVRDTNNNRARSLGSSRYQVAGAADPLRIKAEAEKSAKWMWAFAFVVVGFVVGSLSLKRLWQSSGENKTVDYAAQGVALYKDGEFSAALELLKKASVETPKRKDVWFPLAHLLIQIDSQTLEGRKFLQLATEANTETSAAISNLVGLSYLIDGDYQKAKDAFSKALASDQLYLAAQANMGAVALALKKYDEAEQQFSLSYQKGFRDPNLVIQMVNILISKWRAGGHPTALRDASQLLQIALAQPANHEQELMLTQVYLEWLVANNANLEIKLRRVVDLDPQQTDDFKQNLFLSKSLASWRQVGPWCQQLTDNAGAIAIADALKALCWFRLGRVMEAMVNIEKAVNKTPRDSLIQALYAAILRANGAGGEASVALGRAIDTDRRGENILPLILQARFCQESDDLECAHTYWMKVVERKNLSPAANVGMAQVYLSRNSSVEAQRWLSEARRYAKDYKPMIKLAKKIGG